MKKTKKDQPFSQVERGEVEEIEAEGTAYSQVAKHKEVPCDQGLGRRPACSWSLVSKGGSRSGCSQIMQGLVAMRILNFIMKRKRTR